MKNPTVKCAVCGEFVFGKPKNTKKEVVCQQCRFAKNAHRKFVGVGAALWAKRGGLHHNRAPGGNIVKSLIVVLLLSSSSYAAENRLAVKVFQNQTFTELKGTGSAAAGGQGLGIGVEYLRQLAPRFAVGLEVDRLGRSENESGDVIANAKTTLDGSVLAGLAVARIDLRASDKRVRPYVTGGAGLALVGLRAVVTPNPGATWATGGNAPKTIIDSQALGLAATVRAGVDLAVTSNLSIGAEAGYMRTTPVEHDLTAEGRSVFANESVKGADHGAFFGASIGYRF